MNSVGDVLVVLHSAAASGNVDEEVFSSLLKSLNIVDECEVIDFKRQLPVSDADYAKSARDLVAMHNSFGGFVVFGVDEVDKDRSFEVVGVGVDRIDLAKLRAFLGNYVSGEIRIKSLVVGVDGGEAEIIWVARRRFGEPPVKFLRNGPEIKPGRLSFKKGEVVYREIGSNKIADSPDDYEFLFSERRPPILDGAVDATVKSEPLDNNLPDRAIVCSKFIGRGSDIGDLWLWLGDDFSRVRLIAGEGGLGKTSLAYRFAEEVSARCVKPFERVIWLTAKKRQFIPSSDAYREAANVDFQDAESLCRRIVESLGGIESDFEGLDYKGLMQLALDYCSSSPCFIVIDDVDSLEQADQLRVLEFGMRAPSGIKILLTTRVNFSYSPDNVLKLDGLSIEDYKEYLLVLRGRYNLPQIKDGKAEKLREITGGSPLFSDSLIRLERRGVSLDQAIAQWRGEKGLEVRKAALQREVDQLSKEARRVLLAISVLRNCSYVELSQVVDYAEQTLGDCLQELSSLFLINVPSIAKEIRYSVEPNTGTLVLELAPSLVGDHASLITRARKSREDAIGLGLQKRLNIVGLAISQANALLKAGDGKGALAVIVAASKRLRQPHPDLLLAEGRFSLKQNPPNYDVASRAFESAYKFGQRKPLLFSLWFEAESLRGAMNAAIDVAAMAIEASDYADADWYERRAGVHAQLANRAKSSVSSDTAIREIEMTLSDLANARKAALNAYQKLHLDKLIEQAKAFRTQLIKK